MKKIIGILGIVFGIFSCQPHGICDCAACPSFTLKLINSNDSLPITDAIIKWSIIPNSSGQIFKNDSIGLYKLYTGIGELSVEIIKENLDTIRINNLNIKIYKGCCDSPIAFNYEIIWNYINKSYLITKEEEKLNCHI